MSQAPDHYRTAADVAAITGTAGAFLGWLPAFVALLTAVWTLIRIWETRTVQGLAFWVTRGRLGSRAVRGGEG